MFFVNFQEEQDTIIRSLTGTPRLLLHACCGPCSSACLERLCEYFDVTVCWYNPNIEPSEEYQKRLDNMKKLLKTMPMTRAVSLMTCAYEPERFLSSCEGLENEKEGGQRCAVCFRLRLEETARRAKEGHYDFFTTTLTVSPHKNAPLINDIGQELAHLYGVRFLPSDFKKKNGFLRSIRLSEEYGLYRQNYCGCRFSLREQ